MSSARRFVSCSKTIFTSASATSRPRPSTQLRISRPANHTSSFHTSTFAMAQRTVDSDLISNITHKENEITYQPDPVKGGPTAQAQKHAGDKINDPNVVSDIVKGEDNITHLGGPVDGGPGSFAMSEATQARNEGRATRTTGKETHSGVLDSETISRITHAESDLTGQVEPVQGGPTAQAQKHAGEPINSQNLHDITEGEKKVTGGERVRGGPTATAQSELAKSRS